MKNEKIYCKNCIHEYSIFIKTEKPVPVDVNIYGYIKQIDKCKVKDYICIYDKKIKCSDYECKKWLTKYQDQLLGLMGLIVIFGLLGLMCIDFWFILGFPLYLIIVVIFGIKKYWNSNYVLEKL